MSDLLQGDCPDELWARLKQMAHDHNEELLAAASELSRLQQRNAELEREISAQDAALEGQHQHIVELERGIADEREACAALCDAARESYQRDADKAISPEWRDACKLVVAVATNLAKLTRSRLAQPEKTG